jgi:hypothetical protein
LVIGGQVRGIKETEKRRKEGTEVKCGVGLREGGSEREVRRKTEKREHKRRHGRRNERY